jgi:hypothetical protein
MKKLLLDDLAVESFVVDDAERTRGTVHAHATEFAHLTCAATCPATCQSCVFSCAWTCTRTADGHTCVPYCTDDYTGGPDNWCGSGYTQYNDYTCAVQCRDNTEQ